MTPAAVTPSASSASSRPFIPVTDDPGAASIIAETMTKAKEVRASCCLVWKHVNRTRRSEAAHRQLLHR